MVGWMQLKILEALSQYDPLEVIVGTPIVILLLYICVFRPLEVIDIDCVIEADIMYDYYLAESFLNAEVELKGVEEDESMDS